jgi:signal transduction histidine kinase
VAYFPHLPPGSYKFTVIGANSDAVWSEPAVISITVIAPFWQRWWFIALVVLGVFGMIAVSYQLRLNQLERRRATQEEFSRRLINAHETERQRVAAELHDGLGQSLLVIKNRSLLGEMNSGENGQVEQFKNISEAATQAIEEVRHITYNLRPYHLNRLGLTQAIEAMIEMVAESTPIRFETRIALLDDTFPGESEVVFYRIVQECINNIIKHSEASEAIIEILRKEKEIIIKISDNGRGFAPDQNDSGVSMKTKGGFGLIGMVERVRMLGGTHTIESGAGRGTNVTVKITLPDK